MMTNKLNPVFFLFIGLSILLSSCNPYQKLLKSNDLDLKLEKSKEFYNTEAYHKAIPLLEELIPIYKGRKEVEKLYYFHAYSYYGEGDYLLASYYFKNFIGYYPKSMYTEDAQYMIGYCFYKMSPKASLDQTNTEKAIDAFQLFINTYPYSEKVEKCNTLIDDMRRKLELKYFESAKLYYNIKRYQAAATSFKNLLLRFPDTAKKEEIMFLIIKSYYLYAEKSIKTKQNERYGSAIEAYLNYIDQFPKGKNGREAERLYGFCVDNVGKLKE